MLSHLIYNVLIKRNIIYLSNLRGIYSSWHYISLFYWLLENSKHTYFSNYRMELIFLFSSLCSIEKWTLLYIKYVTLRYFLSWSLSLWNSDINICLFRGVASIRNNICQVSRMATGCWVNQNGSYYYYYYYLLKKKSMEKNLNQITNKQVPTTCYIKSSNSLLRRTYFRSAFNRQEWEKKRSKALPIKHKISTSLTGYFCSSSVRVLSDSPCLKKKCVCRYEAMINSVVFKSITKEMKLKLPN